MSRRSLRLHTPPGEHGVPYGSASFSTGTAARREAPSSKSSRRQHLSVSCSQSLLLQTPRRHSVHPQHNSSLHSVASDASLLSSMLDESCVQERTLMESLWGFDEDVDPQDSTILSGASDTLANSTLVADADPRYHPAQTQTSMINGHPCRDCVQPSDRKQVAGALRGLSGFSRPAPRPGAGGTPLYTAAQNQGLPASRAAASPTSTIYCREKSRRGRLGVFVSVWDSARSVCSRITASLALLLTLSYKHTLLTKHLDHEVSSRSGGGMDSGGPVDQKLNQNQNEPLCEDPKDKPTKPPAVVSPSSTSPSPSLSSSSQSSSFLSSVLYLLLGLLWIASSSAGAYVWQLAQRAGSAGWVITKKSVSDLRASGPSAGQVGSSVLHWLDRGWYHTVSLMSLLKDFLLVRCLPNLFKITLLLILLLLLSVLLGWWDPRELLSSMLGVDRAAWQGALPLTSIPGLAAVLKPPPGPPEQSTDLQTYAEPPPPAVQEEEGEGEEDSPGDSERLQRLEQSLSQLWERVEDGGHRAEQMHSEVLGLYQGLRQQQQALVEQALVEQALVEQAQVEQAQARAEPGRADLEPWLDGLLEDKLAEMRVRLDEDRLHREQIGRQHMAQQKSQALRLAELEQLLQDLTAKMEQVQQRQEAVTTTLRTTSASRLPTAVSVDGESHESLRSDVSRLELALGTVRQDLKGLRGCQDHCERLDHIQEKLFSQVRAQVREELRAALYGNQLVSLSQAAAGSPDHAGDRAALPDSLLQWLAERYVSGADLRASLASLELSILRNVSQQLLQQRCGEPATKDGDDDDDDEGRQAVVTQAVVDSLKAAGAGVTEEQVQLMVRNALRIYSQDRTGLADYALESGGGSILSTRCSETYETRTALLSLFGLPLWYFSQSPRVVIQPDVQPGNCWAFKGSTGYLVIRLSMKVQPTAFSLEHIPKALAPSGALRSAPREFTVYGLDDERQEEGTLLGSYSYEEDGEALQTYDVTEENELAFQIIEVRILSNWGNQEYTCMYRLRVHGIPSNN